MPAAHADRSGHGDSADRPRHVAIIMDGNGRWAARRGLPRAAGHRKGVEAVRRIVRAAGDIGLQTLTLFAFSSENWKRPAEEISDLMGLLTRFIRSDIDEMAKNDVRLRVIGNYRELEPDIVALIDDAVARTEGNKSTELVVALNYGAKDEIARAARALAERAARGEIEAEAIDDRMLEAALDTGGLPPLDLVIRTSGELRLSNFLLWQAAYAELYFTDTLWPDFGPEDLVKAVESFSGRERRYGGR